MKNFLLKTWLTMLCLLVGVWTSWAADATLSFSSEGYTNGQQVSSGNIDSYTKWSATKGGTNEPAYYTTGSGLRVYNGGTFTVSSTKIIASITLTFSGTGYTFSTSNTTTPQTVSPNANSYTWNVSRTCRLQKVEVTYASGGTTPTTYTVTVANNIENGTVSASHTSATEGTEVTLTSTPDDGYEFGSWNVTDASSNAITVTDNKFKMPASDVTVSATFSKIQQGGTPDSEGYTIIFKANSSDSDNNTSLTVNSELTKIFSSGTEYVKNIISAAYVYNAKSSLVNGVKLGSSKNAGNISFTLAEPCNIQKIVVSATPYSDSEGVPGLKLNDKAIDMQSGKANQYADYEISFDGQLVNEISLTHTSGKRVYVQSITIFPVQTDTRVVSNIIADTSNMETTYYEGEKLNPNGLQLTVSYEGETEKEIITYSSANSNKFTFEPSLDTELNGDVTTVKVTYKGQTTNLPITVHTVSIKAPVAEGGQYTVKVGDAEAVTADGSKIAAKKGQTVVLASTPADGYKAQTIPFVVTDEEDDKVTVSKSNGVYSFVMPGKNVEITAKFAVAYTITKGECEHGNIGAIKDKDGVEITATSKGSKVVVEYSADNHYVLSSMFYIKPNDKRVNIEETNGVYSFAMPECDITVCAEFIEEKYTITYYVNGDVLSEEERYGDEDLNFPTDVVSPVTGKVFIGWSTEAFLTRSNEPEMIAANQTSGIRAISNIDYFAVFATAVEGTSEKGVWSKVPHVNDYNWTKEGNKYLFVYETSALSPTHGNKKIAKVFKAETGEGNWVDAYIEPDGTIKNLDPDAAVINISLHGTTPNTYDMRVEGAGTYSYLIANKGLIFTDENGNYLQSDGDKDHTSFTRTNISYDENNGWIIENGLWFRCRPSSKYQFQFYKEETVKSQNGYYSIEIYVNNSGTSYKDYFTNLLENDLTLNETEEAKTKIYKFAKNVTMNRTIKANSWNTFCAPFKMTEEQLKAIDPSIEVKELKGLEYSNDTYTLKFETPAADVEGNIVLTGVPYLVKTSSAVSSITQNDEKGIIVDTRKPGKLTANDIEDSEYDYEVTFYGNYFKQSAPMDSYIISSNKFYLVNSEVTLKGYRGYFNIGCTEKDGAEVSMDSQERSLIFSLESNGVLTSLDGVDLDSNEYEALYNLQGQRIQRAQHGVFIINGKKVIR